MPGDICSTGIRSFDCNSLGVAQIATTSGKEKVKKCISSSKAVGLASLGRIGNSPKKDWHREKEKAEERRALLRSSASPALEEEPSLEGVLVPLKKGLWGILNIQFL